MNEQTDDELWKSWDSNRLTGVVDWISPTGGFGKITGDDGARYFVFLNEVVADVYGLQYLYLAEPVEFDIRPVRRGRDQEPEATKINPVGRSPILFDNKYRDHATVRQLRPDGSGFAQRATGETVFFQQKDVVTEGQLYVGREFRFLPIRPAPGRRMFVAKLIQLYEVEVPQGKE